MRDCDPVVLVLLIRVRGSHASFGCKRKFRHSICSHLLRICACKIVLNLLNSFLNRCHSMSGPANRTWIENMNAFILTPDHICVGFCQRFLDIQSCMDFTFLRRLFAVRYINNCSLYWLYMDLLLFTFCLYQVLYLCRNILLCLLN